jgi:tetratricopeptide (TPR) repeat protein
LIASITAQEEGLEVAFESSINLYNVSLSEKVVAKDGIQKEIDVDVDLAMTLHCIGRLLTRHFENHLFATNAYINSLHLTKKSLGSDHPNVAALLGSIGNICLEREAYDRACTFYKEGLRIEEKYYGESHPEVAVTTFNVGAVEFAQGNYIHALNAFQRTIKIQKAAFGADSALIGLAFHCVGEVAERMNLFPKALKAYQAALEIDEITFGKSHPEVGHTLHKMGKIQYLHLKNYEEAKRLCLAAFDIYMVNEFHDRETRTMDLLRDLGNINAFAQLNS